MTEEALRKPQGGQRHEGSASVLYFAGFRYWTASVPPGDRGHDASILAPPTGILVPVAWRN